MEEQQPVKVRVAEEEEYIPITLPVPDAWPSRIVNGRKHITIPTPTAAGYQPLEVFWNPAWVERAELQAARDATLHTQVDVILVEDCH